MNNDATPRFGFGKNWESFLKHHFSEERLAIAQAHLLKFLGLDDLSGKTMVDVGCGSGLHSMAALRSNVAQLLSFDFDGASVAATRSLRELSGAPQHWRVEQGSILDDEYIARLGQFNIVYSWGVLHHTGDQWKAIRNAASLIAPKGLFYVALYTSDAFVSPPPQFWLDVKRQYNRSGWLGKRATEGWYIAKNVLGMVKARRNPLSFIWNYKRSRGMSYYTDVKDWLGGWPMEFSSIDDVKRFGRDELHLTLIRISAGEANTEYLFARP